MKRVRLSRGASPPGRRPLRASRTGGRALGERRRTGPSPSRCQRSVSPTTTSAASAAAATMPRGPGSTSTGSAVTPNARCVASDALASRRLASRPVSRGPASRSGTSSAAASQAPSSIAVQSCSPPPNGTSTGPRDRSCSRATSTPTSHGAAAARRESPDLRVAVGFPRARAGIDVLFRREPDDVLCRVLVVKHAVRATTPRSRVSAAGSA